MFFYFYSYVPDGNKTEDELSETNKYLAIDHETGEIEYQTSILGEWMKDFIGFEP